MIEGLIQLISFCVKWVFRQFFPKQEVKRDPPTTGNMRLVFDRKPDHVDIYLSLSDTAMEIVKRTNLRTFELLKTAVPPATLAKLRASSNDPEDWEPYVITTLGELIDNYPKKWYDPNPIVLERDIETIRTNLEVVSKQIDQMKKPAGSMLTQHEL